MRRRKKRRGEGKSSFVVIGEKKLYTRKKMFAPIFCIKETKIIFLFLFAIIALLVTQ